MREIDFTLVLRHIYGKETREEYWFGLFPAVDRAVIAAFPPATKIWTEKR
jgi:hypothetical protein